MSMISEQVKKLKMAQREYRIAGNNRLADMLNQAADTIEALSAKLASANMERSEWYHKTQWILMLLRAGQKEAHEKADGLEKGDNMKSFFTGKEAGICKAIDLIENDEQWKNEKRYYGCGWIPVKERRPENDGYYDVTVQAELDGETVRTTEERCFHLDTGIFHPIDPDVEIGKVIAWRHKTEPYNPGAQESVERYYGSGWITDRAPEEIGYYYITTDACKMGDIESDIAKWDGEYWNTFSNVYAWSPIELPEPYNPDGEVAE